MAVIPSATKRKNQAANLAALKVTLTAEEMAAIATLERGERCANPDFAPKWDRADNGSSIARQGEGKSLF